MCRRLVDAGVHVAPVLTETRSASSARVTFSALASEPAHTSLFDGPDPIPHTRLGQTADLVVVAPATAKLHRQVRGRHLRRPPDRDAARDARAGARVPGDAHRDVGAPGGAGEPRDAAAARRARARARGRPPRGRRRRRSAGSPIPSASSAARSALLDCRPVRSPGARVLVTAGGTREPIDPVRYRRQPLVGQDGPRDRGGGRRRGAQVVLVTTRRQPVPPRCRASCGSRPPSEMHDAVMARAPTTATSS